MQQKLSQLIQRLALVYTLTLHMFLSQNFLFLLLKYMA